MYNKRYCRQYAYKYILYSVATYNIIYMEQKRDWLISNIIYYHNATQARNIEGTDGSQDDKSIHISTSSRPHYKVCTLIMIRAIEGRRR